MKPYDVLNLGTAVVDIPVKLPYKVLDFGTDLTMLDGLYVMPGGDAANSSIVLSRLGKKVALVAAVGDDVFSGIFREQMSESGIDVSQLIVKHGAYMSVSLVMINAAGDRCFLCTKGNNDLLLESDFDMSLLRSGARHLNYSSFFLHPHLDRGGIAAIFKAAKANGLTVSADVNFDKFRLGFDTIRPCLKYVDLFMPSYIEAKYMTGETEPKRMAQFLANQTGDKIIIIKLGEDGSYFYHHGRGEIIPAFSVDVVDTTGAGDNFVAGVICSFLDGMDLKDCVRFGSAAAALNIQHIGATNDHVTLEAVKRFLKAH